MSLRLFERLGLGTTDIDRTIDILLELRDALQQLSKCEKRKLLESYTDFGGYPSDFKELVALLTKVEAYVELIEQRYPAFKQFIDDVLRSLYDVRHLTSSAVFSYIDGINIDYYPAPHLSSVTEEVDVNDIDINVVPYTEDIEVGEHFIACSLERQDNIQKIILSFKSPIKATRIWMPIFGAKVKRLLINTVSAGFDYWYGYIVPIHRVINADDKVTIIVEMMMKPRFEAVKKPADVWKLYKKPTWIGDTVILKPRLVLDISSGAGLLETTTLPMVFGDNGSIVPFVKVNGIYFPAIGREYSGLPFPFHYDGRYYYFPIYTSGDFTSSTPLMGYRTEYRLFKSSSLPELSYEVDFSGFTHWVFWNPWKNKIEAYPSEGLFAIPHLESELIMMPPPPTELPEEHE